MNLVADVPDLHLLSLRFAVLAPIKRLPHYHGPQWSALFRDLIRECGPEAAAFAGAPIRVHPIESGIAEYRPGDQISLGLSFGNVAAKAAQILLFRLNALTGSGMGHFQPGTTIRLEAALSRRTGLPWAATDQPLSLEDLEPEIEQLCSLDRFAIQTLSPLRIPRPPGTKTTGHGYCDADFFFAPGNPMSHLLRRMDERQPPDHESALTVAGGGLTWLDVAYGFGAKRTTFGGVVGALAIKGRPTRWEAELLVRGQYCGLGKNRAFGLGLYHIPEIHAARRILPLKRRTTLLARAIDEQNVRQALADLPNSAPGPDQMTVADARAAGDPLLHAIRDHALAAPVTERVDLLCHRLPKPQGGHRSIYLQNVRERILHRTFADALSPSLDGLLSSSAYAYRRGLSRHKAAATLRRLLAEGYNQGLKADIAAFFDSINAADLCSLLIGLYPAEPLVEQLRSWLLAVREQGIAGLPQGWSLSPPLSNLYLERFDRAMEQEGFRLVRFADDFVVLIKGDSGAGDCLERVEASLARLGLALNQEKTTRLIQGQPIPFLGFLVSASEIEETNAREKPSEEDWDTVFRAEWRQGVPIYLTTLCRGAYSSGPHLVVNQVGDRNETIPWSQVGRLVIVGRSTFSGGVIYRAVREQVPVTFIDIMGRATGCLIKSPDHEEPLLAKEQRRKSANQEWVLDCSRRLIGAKIHNCRILLRRNAVDASPLAELANAAAAADNLDSLRGIEGVAARIYFEHFATLVAPFEFRGRSYRPPDGPVNVLLSFGYTLLYNRLTAALRDKGFNPRQGIFHVGRGRHAALASDLMEPLRHIIDRVVLAVIHLRELNPDMFTSEQRGAVTVCRMNGEGFRIVINRYEQTMATVFTPRKGARMSYNQWLDETIDDLRRAIRFDLPYLPLRIA